MSNIAIFKNQTAVTNSEMAGLTDLAKSLNTGGKIRRIQTNTNGTFRRVVGGEQIGKAIRGEFNAIIVAMLPNVSRTFYAGAYDPNAKPTLPDCWSNDGITPEDRATEKQASSCAKCPNNVDGSGDNGKGRACRFNRRVALLLEGDSTGEVYQFNIPAKSLFGKGDGNTHPYESYYKFLNANNVSIDRVVTTIAYDLDADSMQINFTPSRFIDQEELELVKAAQADPETQRCIELTVAGADGARPKSDGDTTGAAGGDSSPGKPKPEPEVAAKKKPAFLDDEDEEEAPAEPVKRAAKKQDAPKPKADLASTVAQWLEDDE